MEDPLSAAALLTEADDKHKLTRPLIQVRVTLFVEPGTYVPDMLTRIRILPTVSSVTQDRDYFARENPAAVAVDASLKSAIPDRVDPLRGATSSAGRSMINTLVRFLPESVTVGDAVKELAERVRSIPGVMKVQFDELNGRPLTVGGSPVVF